MPVRSHTTVKGVRLEDTVWDALAGLAASRSTSRNELIEAAVKETLYEAGKLPRPSSSPAPAGGEHNPFIDGPEDGDDDFSDLPEFSSRLEADKHARDHGYPQARARAAWKAQREKLKR